MSESDQLQNVTDLPANVDVCLDRKAASNRRLWGALLALAISLLAFTPVFLVWFRIAMGSELHSHVVLIPLVSAYLLVTHRKDFALNSRPSRLAGIGVISLFGGIHGWTLASNPPWSEVDLTALRILTFVGIVWGIGFLCAGGRWMRTAIFPMGFLLFMVPLPDRAVEQLEKLLMVMSARLAETIFSIGGVPVFRDGQVIELPGVLLNVAQECSGIRSSWVLFITSVLAAYLFLPTIPRRIALVAAVLPLGILRNAVRIYVIGWLCVHVGPEMIDSWIHRRGGPVFFAISLLPLFVMAWLLRMRGPSNSPMDKQNNVNAD